MEKTPYAEYRLILTEKMTICKVLLIFCLFSFS